MFFFFFYIYALSVIIQEVFLPKNGEQGDKGFTLLKFFVIQIKKSG